MASSIRKCGSPATPISTEIEEFVREHLPDAPPGNRAPKVVHDGLWGTLRLPSHETAFTDTPLLQRLRQLHQTGNTLFTYPSTTHTRFEHTLGVVYQADRLGKALLDHGSQFAFAAPDIAHMRLAALLHDVGHGLFSHTSEEVYSQLPVMADLRRMPVYQSASPHEILSHQILSTASFHDYAHKVAEQYSASIPLDEISGAIVGHSPDPARTFKREILNGPFDADKLDYLFRDGHFSGLPLTVDLDRLFYTVRIAEVEGTPRLVVTQSGATPLEQILFSKMVLHTTVYQHHKVRACDCMFAGIVEYMRANGLFMRVRNRRIDWSSPVHFLWASEAGLLSLGFESRNKQLHHLIHNLYYRRTLQRAMLISRRTIRQGDKEDRWDEVQRLATRNPEAAAGRRALAKRIWRKAGKPCMLEEVWVDLPALPNMKTAATTYVLAADDGKSRPIPLNQLFPSDQWIKNYGENKWRGHVFCPPEHTDRIARAAKAIFEDDYGVQVKPEAFSWCKVSPPK